PAKIFGIAQDITKRKQVELALQDRETLYRALFEQANDGVILHDALTGRTVAANQAIADLLECKVEDFVGKLYTDGIKANEIADIQTQWQFTLKKGYYPTYERLVQTLKGQSRYLETSAHVIYDDHNTPRYVQTILRDITRRKKAEQQLQTALEEKEILLKEIHHRVKNNLQVISSLLYLQSQKIKDRHLEELFRESRNRVAAMALVHEHLYQSNNFAQVDFGSYANTLILALFDSYGIDTTQIQFEVESDGTTLDIHSAIPCGLLISEIISNSLKYAFPHQNGKVTLTLRTSEARHHLWIQDDGVGMPPVSHQRPGSLGLQLIERLTAQIGGTLERQGPPGTVHHIVFQTIEKGSHQN
ncbi:MAG TPA: histidine kinase dimerization/phosphoacceptor domain -containing protein, partial [Anaerolineales bacterium]|nr:histidine kinase dimerization/phosphoacceptor domain -containing protein [Anaerolineales bacterium]